MKIKVFTLLIFITFIQLYAAFEETESSTRAEGMAEAVTAVCIDPLDAIYNPAGLVNLNSIKIISYFRKPFGLFQSAGAGFAVPTKIGVSAISLRWFSVKGEYRGSDSTLIDDNSTLHSESTISFSHALNLQKNFAAGFSLNIYNLKQARFGSTFAWGLDLGFSGNLYRKWKMGISVHNLNSPEVGKEHPEDLPRVVRAGVAFSPVENISSSFDFRHEVGYPVRIAFGQEFTLSEYLMLRAGIQTEPVRFSGGITISYSGFNIDYAIIQHSELPFTHQIALGYVFR